MSNSYTTKNIKSINQKKLIETSRSIKNLFLFSMFVVFALVSPDLLAAEDGILAAQTNSIHTLLNGKIVPILTLLGFGTASYLAWKESSLKPVGVGVIAAVFLYVAKTWSVSTYACLI